MGGRGVAGGDAGEVENGGAKVELGGEGGLPSFKCLLTFPSGDQLELSSYHVHRMRYNSTSVPINQGRISVGIAHALFIKKGLKPPDAFKQSFGVERLAADGKKSLRYGPTIHCTGPSEYGLNTQLLRVMSVQKAVRVRDCSCKPHEEGTPYQPRCWLDGTYDNYNETTAWYTLVYDPFNLTIVSKDLEVIFLKRNQLIPVDGHLTGKEDSGSATLALASALPPSPLAKRRALHRQATMEIVADHDDDDEDGDAMQGVDVAGHSRNVPIAALRLHPINTTDIN